MQTKLLTVKEEFKALLSVHVPTAQNVLLCNLFLRHPTEVKTLLEDLTPGEIEKSSHTATNFLAEHGSSLAPPCARMVLERVINGSRMKMSSADWARNVKKLTLAVQDFNFSYALDALEKEVKLSSFQKDQKAQDDLLEAFLGQIKNVEKDDRITHFVVKFFPWEKVYQFALATKDNVLIQKNLAESFYVHFSAFFFKKDNTPAENKAVIDLFAFLPQKQIKSHRHSPLLFSDSKRYFDILENLPLAPAVKQVFIPQPNIFSKFISPLADKWEERGAEGRKDILKKACQWPFDQDGFGEENKQALVDALQKGVLNSLLSSPFRIKNQKGLHDFLEELENHSEIKELFLSQTVSSWGLAGNFASILPQKWHSQKDVKERDNIAASFYSAKCQDIKDVLPPSVCDVWEFVAAIFSSRPLPLAVLPSTKFPNTASGKEWEVLLQKHNLTQSLNPGQKVSLGARKM